MQCEVTVEHHDIAPGAHGQASTVHHTQVVSGVGGDTFGGVQDAEAQAVDHIAQGLVQGQGRARQRAIGRELRRMYDDVAQEAVPDDFMDLLRQIDEADDKGGKKVS